MSHARVLAEKILVADDDRTTRFAISSVLKKAGYAVTAPKDGAEALRNIQQTSFDLVFLDIWMPELTGLEVLARVRVYRLPDPGPGFSFKVLTHAAVGQAAEEPIAHVAVRDQLGIRSGGFGIAMTRTIADELIYNEAQNEVMDR